MDIVTTPAYPSANSYITVEQAEDYLVNYSRIPSDSSWFNLTDNQKQYALILAAYALNTLPFKGYKVVKSQSLAFPRYTWIDINSLGKTTYTTFDNAVDSNELTTAVLNANINVVNGQFVLQDIDQDFSLINKLDVIKISGFVNNSGYFTVKNVTDDTITPYEDVVDETGTGIDIYITPIPGVPDNVRDAQAEMAWQVINTNIFQKDITDYPEPPIRSLNLGGVLSINYQREIYNTRFSLTQSSPIDIIYYLLSPWLTSVRGRFV